MSVIEIHMYQSDNSTFLAVLEQAYEIKYLAELNGVGSGSFSFPRTGAKAANVAVGNVARVRIDNVDVGAFVLEQVKENLLSEGKQAIQASGRGLLALFERAIVWPSDVNNYHTAERQFLGVTFASMIEDLVAEAVARGVTLPANDFSPTLDSAAQAWTDSSSLAYRAGTTLLDVIEQHASLGPEVTIGANGTLHYWKQAGQDRSSDVVFWEGRHVVWSERITSHKDLMNAVLGQGQYRFSVSTDAGSIASYGRRERLANFGNVSDATQLGVLAGRARDGWKAPAQQIDLVVTDDALTPLISYGLGDTVAVRLQTAGLNASYRIRSIAIEQDGESHVRAQVSLNTLVDEYLLRVDRALRRMLMSPVESVVEGNTDPNVGGWRLSNSYLIYDTGVASTSAGLAPLDYPFYAGATYANRASAPCRVTAAGVLTAAGATITGTINFGSGYGQLNATGFSFAVDANNYVKVDTSGADSSYLYAARNAGIVASLKSTSTASGTRVMFITWDGPGTAISVTNAGNSTPTGVGIEGYSENGVGLQGFTNDGVAVKGKGAGGVGVYATAGVGVPLVVEQITDNTVHLTKFIGKSAASSPLSKNVVKESDVSAATRAGWLMVYVQDDGDRITDQKYFLPIYTLT